MIENRSVSFRWEYRDCHCSSSLLLLLLLLLSPPSTAAHANECEQVLTQFIEQQGTVCSPCTYISSSSGWLLSLDAYSSCGRTPSVPGTACSRTGLWSSLGYPLCMHSDRPICGWTLPPLLRSCGSSALALPRAILTYSRSMYGMSSEMLESAENLRHKAWRKWKNHPETRAWCHVLVMALLGLLALFEVYDDCFWSHMLNH